MVTHDSNQGPTISRTSTPIPKLLKTASKASVLIVSAPPFAGAVGSTPVTALGLPDAVISPPPVPTELVGVAYPVLITTLLLLLTAGDADVTISDGPRALVGAEYAVSPVAGTE